MLSTSFQSVWISDVIIPYFSGIEFELHLLLRNWNCNCWIRMIILRDNIPFKGWIGKILLFLLLWHKSRMVILPQGTYPLAPELLKSDKLMDLDPDPAWNWIGAESQHWNYNITSMNAQDSHYVPLPFTSANHSERWIIFFVIRNVMSRIFATSTLMLLLLSPPDEEAETYTTI